MTDPKLQQRIALIESFDDFIDGVFAPLEAWLPTLQAQLTDRLSRGSLTGMQLTAMVEAASLAILESTNRPIYGAGYCATDKIVTEGNPLAWWQGPDKALLASSTFGHGQAAIDLQRLEWYRVPAETMQNHVAGPFVDYLCSNEVTLTIAIPVMLNDEFSGVICADILVASLEELLLPQLAALGDVALVNESGRVVVSADPQYETGDRFVGESWRQSSDKYPFALVAA